MPSMPSANRRRESTPGDSRHRSGRELTPGEVWKVYEPQLESPRALKHTAYLVTMRGNIDVPLFFIHVSDGLVYADDPNRQAKYDKRQAATRLKLAKLLARDFRYIIGAIRAMDCRGWYVERFHQRFSEYRLAKVGAGAHAAIYRCNPQRCVQPAARTQSAWEIEIERAIENVRGLLSLDRSAPVIHSEYRYKSSTDLLYDWVIHRLRRERRIESQRIRKGLALHKQNWGKL